MTYRAMWLRVAFPAFAVGGGESVLGGWGEDVQELMAEMKRMAVKYNSCFILKFD